MIINYKKTKKTKKTKKAQRAKKTKSISYFCGGKKPLLELLVSLYTLRRFYKGDIIVGLGETSVPYMQPLLECNDFITVVVPDSKKHRSKSSHKSDRWKFMKTTNSYDQTMHFDCDNIVVGDFSPLWNMIQPDKECITALYHRKEWDKKKRKKFNYTLSEYGKIIPDFKCKINDIVYMQLGCFGYNKGWPHFDEVSEYCKKVQSDQMALSLVLTLHKAPVKFVETYYYINCKRYARFVNAEKRKQVAIWHCKRCLSISIWWKCFMEARKNKFLSLHDNDYIKSINDTASLFLENKDWDNKILNPCELWQKEGEVLETIPRDM